MAMDTPGLLQKFPHIAPPALDFFRAMVGGLHTVLVHDGPQRLKKLEQVLAGARCLRPGCLFASPRPWHSLSWNGRLRHKSKS